MEKKTKKVKKCLTEMIEHDKLKKSPREADKKQGKGALIGANDNADVI